MTEVNAVSRRRRRAWIALVVLFGIAACAFFLIMHRGAAPLAAQPSAAAIGDDARAPRGDSAARSKAATTRPKPRVDTTNSLPAPGTRLVEIYAELKARADAGDAAAASRLYRDLHRCIGAAYEVRDLSRPPAMQEIPDNLSPEKRAKFVAAREQMLAERPARLRDAQRDLAMCEGLAREQRLVLPALRRAAQLGDQDAAVCYVSGQGLWNQDVLNHPEWLTEYKATALAMADEAVARGNLGVVYMLSTAYAGASPDGTLSQLTGTDPALRYRYSKLASLARRDLGTGEMGVEAAALALTAADRAAADAWAQDMFMRHFSETQRRVFAVCAPEVTEELNAQINAQTR